MPSTNVVDNLWTTVPESLPFDAISESRWNDSSKVKDGIQMRRPEALRAVDSKLGEIRKHRENHEAQLHELQEAINEFRHEYAKELASNGQPQNDAEQWRKATKDKRASALEKLQSITPLRELSTTVLACAGRARLRKPSDSFSASTSGQRSSACGTTA